ncbi:hypothetical protein ATCC90586_005903 [Pythium insidiosum]|nr:hypothetical protein ATCC90586_005903 [Pythium insidiosum]
MSVSMLPVVACGRGLHASRRAALSRLAYPVVTGRRALGAALPFSSKRRTRFHESPAEQRRSDKLFSALRVKQQAQLARLRDALDREQRRSSKQESVAPPKPDDLDAQLREFQQLMARKEARKQRVKHLPLFREDSPLWRRHGAETSLRDFDGLPSIAFDGPVSVVLSAADEREHVPYLSTQNIIGIDTESMPRLCHRQRPNPVCLIQIATLERSFLYRLRRGAALPPYLRAMLESPRVIKVGHSLEDDFRLIKKAKLVTAVNTTLDTLPVATQLGCLRPGLKTLCQLFLGGIISKEMQVSNWEAAELSDDQIRYAATDAWAPLRVMIEMVQFEDVRRRLRVKSYDASSGQRVDDDATERVMSVLQECALTLRTDAR